MVWQALAWLTPVHIGEQAQAVAHMLVHAQALDHHHHDDHTLHLEDDGSEPPHQHANQAAQLPGLPPAMAPGAVDPVPSVWVPGARHGHAPVVPEGLLRPPRGRAALA